MTMFIIQSLLLMAIAYILGCIIGCLLRRLLAKPEASTAAAAVAAPVAAVAVAKQAEPEALQSLSRSPLPSLKQHLSQKRALPSQRLQVVRKMT